MAKPRGPSRSTHLVRGLLIAALATVGAGQLVSAHTDFESSEPTDGEVVEGPLTAVVLNFTNPAEPSGEGFELLEPSGAIRTPTSVDETDGTTFVLGFEPALGVGIYGLRWQVRAGDAHPIDGAFRFEVHAPAPTTTAAEAATATITPTTPTSAAPTSTSTPPAVTVVGSSTSTTVVAPAFGSGATPTTIDVPGAATSLDDFLAESSLGAAGNLGKAGRAVTMFGLIFGGGVVTALVWTIRGGRHELDTLVGWIRLSGIVVLTGGLIELAALSESESAATIRGLLTTKAGVATALKMAGGLAVFFGFHRTAGRVVAPAQSLSAAVGTDLMFNHGAGVGDGLPHAEHRWTPTSSAAVGVAGYALVLASYWFDGHTVSDGPWLVHGLVNLVHVSAAIVWGGGVFAMTTVAWMRRRRSERVGLASMVVRFSSLAALSLASMVVAGLVMTWMILDSPRDLFGTQWGKALIAKTAVVAVAAAIGGYNHFRLRPALVRRPDDPALARELRVSLLVESALFVAVIGLTAVLVAAAT